VNIMLTVLAVSLLIVVHEFGHFLGARAVGMRVEVFSIGFWKRVIGFKKGHTDYRLSLVPFGGYLKVAGESPQEGSGKPYEFWSKTPGQRAIYVVGGVAMNFVLALVLFIFAFTVGVPFAVAEVGQTMKGSPAWKSGLMEGDRIVALNGQENPTFADLTRAVILGGEHRAELEVRRDGRLYTFSIQPEYDERVGYKVIGIVPPVQPIITGFQKIGGEEGRCPAREAGARLGDRIMRVNGSPVATATELNRELLKASDGAVELTVRRDAQQVALTVRPEPLARSVIGITGVTSTIESLEKGGRAEAVGLRPGDRIAAVNGQRVTSGVEIEEAIRGSWGETRMEVLRGGEAIPCTSPITDAAVLEEFMFSMLFEAGTTLTWVEPGGPAWRAGLRPGDVITAVAGERVEAWEDILLETDRAGEGPFEVRWRRNGQLFAGEVTPAEKVLPGSAHLGIIMDRAKSRPLRYGVVGAVANGISNTVEKIAEVVLILRGFATRQVSPRHMGGIVTIAYASYRAAEEGMGKLLYMTAVISAAIAFFNVLPIPVLDGGHLLFLGIEKIRGRRLSERVMAAAQTVGFVLLMMLVIYVTRNDILRLLQLR
jgi:regulator of sigma E protease